jgi:hypothetical protein
MTVLVIGRCALKREKNKTWTLRLTPGWTGVCGEFIKSRGDGRLIRHARRLNVNLQQEVHVRRWCEKRGLTLRITNGGHHWQITDGRFLAEWWPSSAKLVTGKCWQDGIHCHDYKQVLKVIEDLLEKERAYH